MSHLVHCSIDKWGGQLKTTKRDIRNYMILELKGINKDLRCKILFDLLGFCEMSFLVPYNF